MSSKICQGIKRNKTDMLNLCKEARRKKPSRFTKQSLSEEINSYKVETPVIKAPLFQQQMMPTMSSLPPQWVDKYEECLSLIKKIDDIKKRILTEQNRRLSSIKISDQKQAERRIYELAVSATTTIRRCQKIIEEIKNRSENQSNSNKLACKNMCVGLALSVQERTKELRAQQRAFMEQRKHLEQSTKVSFLELAAERVYEDDFVEDEAEKMDELQFKIHEERNQEILKIVESIHELNDLYKELNNLVIIQGSLLDRIDYNIDESAFQIKKGTEILKKVDDRQKKSKCACRVMAIMIIGVIILGIILIVRWSK